ncbi:4-carboxy-4-hydroxy-2-oxoadipate aldolase [Baekduia alba]|uniref:RraA family protein n=1 Tax=Baekduia alba TaxID=2997333 RepID=UPI00234126FC|nr:RraA family protein [Baekduia alba]WCB92277.1 4-carboxy-4-hydroxy-2-oxoadipate aldolase [Baekduia alba]
MTATQSTVDRAAIRERFQSVDTSNVADVLDALGLPDQGLDSSFAPIAGQGRLAGWAFTISGRLTPYASDGGDPLKMEACGALTPDSISVWSGAGAGVCFFGELIALGMQERGCVGALVDGGVRDVRWLEQLSFPVFARYRTPVQSIGRWKVEAYATPVSMPGATRPAVAVAPGDFVLADADGAIVVPADVVTTVLERAEEMGRREAEIRAQLAGGMTLGAALERFGHV